MTKFWDRLAEWIADHAFLFSLVVAGLVAGTLILTVGPAEAQHTIVDEQYLGGDTLRVYELIIEEKDLECIVVTKSGSGMWGHCWKIVAYP
jgi:hypothetical protein